MARARETIRRILVKIYRMTWYTVMFGSVGIILYGQIYLLPLYWSTWPATGMLLSDVEMALLTFSYYVPKIMTTPIMIIASIMWFFSGILQIRRASKKQYFMIDVGESMPKK